MPLFFCSGGHLDRTELRWQRRVGDFSFRWVFCRFISGDDSVGRFNILTRSQVIHEFGPKLVGATLPNTHNTILKAHQTAFNTQIDV